MKTPFVLEQEVENKDTVVFRIRDTRLEGKLSQHYAFSNGHYPETRLSVERNPIDGMPFVVAFLGFVSFVFVMVYIETAYHHGKVAANWTPLWLWFYYVFMASLLSFVMGKYYESNFEYRILKKKARLQKMTHEIWAKEQEAEKTKEHLTSELETLIS